jgi:ATP/maltotriose-dependent transcriptional regulator MalT
MMRTRLNGPLVGRDEVLSNLRRALVTARDGAGAGVILEGPAGIGKSRLLGEAAREAQHLGMVVAAARATELDRIAPLTTLLMALRGCQPAVLDGTGLARLGAVEGQHDNAFWLVNQVGVYIEEYAATRPLLIVLDDVQWADELTALALRILVPALSSSPVLWLLASRPPNGPSPTSAVIGWLTDDGALQVRLEPLCDEAVVAMCAEMLGAQPGPEILALARRARGNPFLVEQLVLAFRRSGWNEGQDGFFVSADDTLLPGELLASIDFRLRPLSRAARQVLDASAVLGMAFTVSEVAAVIGAEPAEIETAIAELLDEGVLRGSGAELEFQHDLVRDAVYSRLTDSMRRGLHGEAGRVLLDRGRSVTEVATHLLRGGRKGDQATILLLRQAVLELASTAPNTAADLMLEVLGLLEDRDPARPSLVAAAVRLLASASRLTEAMDLGEAALRFPLDEETQATMLLGLAEACKHAGRDTSAVAYARRALAMPAIPGRLQAQLLAVQAHAMLCSGDVDGADQAAARAIDVGNGCAEHSAVVFGTAASSAVAQTRGRVTDAIDLAGEAVQLADATGGEARHRHPRLWLGRALVAADRFAEAEAEFELGEREARESGAAWSLPLWHLYRAELKVAEGNLDDARAEAESGIAVSERLSAYALTPSLRVLLSFIGIRRGEMTAAEEHLRRARTGGGGDLGPVPILPRALLLEAAGEPEAAVKLLSPYYAGFSQRALHLTLLPDIGPHLVRLALGVGDRAKAQSAAAAAGRLFELNPASATFAGVAAHAEGLLSGDLATLHEATAHLQRSPRRLVRASALEDAGAADDAAGDHTRAVLLLEEAHEHYTASGARIDAARVEKRLRALGVQRRRPRATSRASAGPDSLTESELRVAGLVAEGLTNRAVAERLFLSPHTVDAHLRHAFAKLGVSSRVELTRALLLHAKA